MLSARDKHCSCLVNQSGKSLIFVPKEADLARLVAPMTDVLWCGFCMGGAAFVCIVSVCMSLVQADSADDRESP